MLKMDLKLPFVEKEEHPPMGGGCVRVIEQSFYKTQMAPAAAVWKCLTCVPVVLCLLELNLGINRFLAERILTGTLICDRDNIHCSLHNLHSVFSLEAAGARREEAGVSAAVVETSGKYLISVTWLAAVCSSSTLRCLLLLLHLNGMFYSISNGF